jgi:hypothetical protein
MTATWHVDEAALARWVDGTDGAVSGASVEQHLLTCADCRARVPAAPVAESVWSRVRDTVEVPRPTLLERFLRSTGLPAADARIVAVRPAFRAGWLVGMAGLLAFVTVAGSFGSARGQWVFLLVAPLVPALAVALGYDPELDEQLEAECATPYSRLRLVLLRSAALLLVGIPSMVVASLALPGSMAFWWLAPAAGCTAVVLALSTWTTPLNAAASVGTAWLVVVGSTFRTHAPTDVLDDEWVAVYLVVAVVALGVMVLRRGRMAWVAR